MEYWRWAVLIGASGLVAGAVALPSHKANPVLVQSITAIAVLHEISDPDIAMHFEVEPSDRPDVSIIAGQGTKTSSSAGLGLRQDRKTSYAFRARARSRCFELEPGCLKVENRTLSATVAVEVPL